MRYHHRHSASPARKLLNCALASCLLLGAAPAFAQSTAATIRGQVTVDPAPAAQAQVTATNLATGLIRTVQVSKGGYSVGGLPPGSYRIDVTSNGQTRSQNVTVQVGQTATLNLGVGGEPATTAGGNATTLDAAQVKAPPVLVETRTSENVTYWNQAPIKNGNGHILSYAPVRGNKTDIEHWIVNVGMRYDYEKTPSFLDFVSPSDLASALQNWPNLRNASYNMNDFISTGNNRKAFKNAWQLRLGASYDLFGDQAHVVHGGAGRAYDRNIFDYLAMEQINNSFASRTTAGARPAAFQRTGWWSPGSTSCLTRSSCRARCRWPARPRATARIALPATPVPDHPVQAGWYAGLQGIEHRRE